MQDRNTFVSPIATLIKKALYQDSIDALESIQKLIEQNDKTCLATMPAEMDESLIHTLLEKLASISKNHLEVENKIAEFKALLVLAEEMLNKIREIHEVTYDFSYATDVDSAIHSIYHKSNSAGLHARALVKKLQEDIKIETSKLSLLSAQYTVYLQLTQTVLSLEVNPFAQNLAEKFPIQVAADLGIWEVVDQLLDNDYPTSILDDILWLALKSKTVKEQTILNILHYGANPNCTNDYGFTPMQDAIQSKNWEKVLILAKYDPHLQYTILKKRHPHTDPLFRPYHKTFFPLITQATHAAYTIPENVLRAILVAGADPNQALLSTQYATLLHVAAKRSDEKIIELLLEFGADPSVRNENNITAYTLVKNSQTQKKTFEKAASHVLINTILQALPTIDALKSVSVTGVPIPAEIISLICAHAFPQKLIKPTKLLNYHAELRATAKENAKLIEAFKRIYTALFSTEKNPFKINFLKDKAAMSHKSLLTIIQKKAQDNPHSRIAKAWQLANEFKNNCTDENAELVKKIQNSALKTNSFFAFAPKGVNANEKISSTIHQALRH